MEMLRDVKKKTIWWSQFQVPPSAYLEQPSTNAPTQIKWRLASAGNSEPNTPSQVSWIAAWHHRGRLSEVQLEQGRGNSKIILLLQQAHTTITTTTTITSATRPTLKRKAMKHVLTTPITTTTTTIRINTMDTTPTITMIKTGNTIMTPRTTRRNLMGHLTSQIGTEVLLYWLSL